MSRQRENAVLKKSKYSSKIGKLVAVLVCALAMAPHSFSVAAAGELKARAVVKANNSATISVTLSARVKSLPFREGEAFEKGDELISFECGRYLADFRAKFAAYKGRALVVKNNKRLLRHQAVGKNELAISISQMAEAKAIKDGQAALVEQCQILAPFNGRMVEHLISAHEIPAPNQPLFKIIDTSKIEVNLIVSSRWLVWLKTQTPFTVQLDETGVLMKAKVTRIGAIVDAVSQTIKITGEFLSPAHKVLPGMSGTATFSDAGS